MTEEFLWKYYERPKRIIEGWRNLLLGWDNPILIQRDVDKHRNELVWDRPFNVVKLLGWTDQYDDDYYYVIAENRGITLYSCVGGFTWLKKYLPFWEYANAAVVFNLNYSQDLIEQEIKEKGIILK